MYDTPKHEVLSKVPEVTLAFWIIKIAATTLGETAGDSVTMTLGWGYLAGTALFLGLLMAPRSWSDAQALHVVWALSRHSPLEKKTHGWAEPHALIIVAINMPSTSRVPNIFSNAITP
jgi:hypothetical protein